MSEEEVPNATGEEQPGTGEAEEEAPPEAEETQEASNPQPGTGEAEEEAPPEAEETQEDLNPQPPACELKVVIIMKADGFMLGVQSTDCDPVYKTMKGDLDAALQQVPELVAEAREKWAAAPLNPKANLPEPPPRQTPARTPAVSTSTSSKPRFF